jgi:hypothetical protein
MATLRRVVSDCASERPGGISEGILGRRRMSNRATLHSIDQRTWAKPASVRALGLEVCTYGKANDLTCQTDFSCERKLGQLSNEA